MELIVGLGNRGEKHIHNRHNAGFMMIDYIAREKYKISLKYDKYVQSEIGVYERHDTKIILMKPQTFMNQSGDAVRACADRYSFNPTHDLFVIHDDLDIRLGEYKIQKGKGPKLHNGIASIEKALSASDFWRVRIGIDNRRTDNRIIGEMYVLQDFEEKEREKLQAVFELVFKKLFS